MSPRELPRRRALVLVRRQLRRKGSPYFVLFVVLAATGLAGFLSSVVLRSAGLTSMALRYPVCVALAYLVFLFQLYLYVSFHRRGGGALDSDGAADVADAAADVAYALESTAPEPAPAAPVDSGTTEGEGWLGNLFGGGGGDGDDGIGAVAALAVIVVLVVAALVASAVVLAEAPVLLAEVLVDGVLMASMARRLRRVNPHDWVYSVVKKTLWPAVTVGAVFAAGGYALEQVSPGATTVGEALGEKGR